MLQLKNKLILWYNYFIIQLLALKNHAVLMEQFSFVLFDFTACTASFARKKQPWFLMTRRSRGELSRPIVRVKIFNARKSVYVP